MKLLYSAGQLETAADVSSTVETGRQAFCADHKNCDFNENPPAAKAAARGFLILSLCRPPDRERETLYLHLSLNIKYSQKGAPIVFECIIICRFCAQWSCFGFGNLHTDIHAGHLKKRKGMYENVFDREVFGCGKQCGGRICRHGSACSRKRLCRTDGHAWGLPQNSRGALRAARIPSHSFHFSPGCGRATRVLRSRRCMSTTEFAEAKRTATRNFVFLSAHSLGSL